MKFISIILSKHLNTLLLFLAAIIFFSKLEDLFKKSSSEKLDRDETFNDNNSGLSDLHAKSIADGFYAATVTEGYSNTLELIKPLFTKLKTQADFNKVFNVFGKRQYSHFWGNQGDPLTSDNQDLIQILHNELDNEEQAEIIRLYPHIKVF